MKIVHIHQFFDSGMGYQENILPEYHKDLGNDVIMITSTRKYGFKKNEDRVENTGEFLENNFLVRRIDILWEFPKRFVKFKNLYAELEQEKPDYIFHHSVTSPSIITVARYKKNHPHTVLVMDNHADLVISGRNYFWKVFYYNFFWKIQLKFVSKFVNRFFGVTPSRCDFLKNELGISSQKISLLPIGADVKRASKVGNKSDLKILFVKENNLPKECKLVCHGGKMSIYKNTDTLIKGFNRVANKNVFLVLFGSIEDSQLEELVKQNKRIIYLGWLNRTKTLELLTLSDFGIWNSQHTTLLEDSIACNLPLILKKYGSTEHLIENNGVFLQNGSEEDIQRVIENLCENENVMSDLMEGARAMKSKLSYINIAKESLNMSSWDEIG